MNNGDPQSYLPLREPTFYILLSLIPNPGHGYAIMKDVEGLSGGRVVLSTGTLYEALVRLQEQGLIERVDGNDAHAAGRARPGKPRKVYRLTRSGRQVLEAEAHRLQAQAAAAHRRLGDDFSGETI